MLAFKSKLGVTEISRPCSVNSEANMRRYDEVEHHWMLIS